MPYLIFQIVRILVGDHVVDGFRCFKFTVLDMAFCNFGKYFAFYCSARATALAISVDSVLVICAEGNTLAVSCAFAKRPVNVKANVQRANAMRLIPEV